MESDVVLVTGGTGSFGKTMVGHLLAQGYSEIRILSRDEWKQEDMRLRFNSDSLRFYLGDVRSRPSVDNAMHGVDLVFHAAALKQVPSCEFFPMQAVHTNVVGSDNVIRSAIGHDVRTVLCLGTDKAVYPVNSMGMTKALMEKVVAAAARDVRGHSTIVCSVRYGNVMYSRGSVIPLFIQQLLGGGPITVTEPSMTRFMMPLSESVELVEFAFRHARQGDLFIRKARATSIATLIQALMILFECRVPVRTIGIRHGEKLHETLASAEELARAEDLGNYYRISLDGRDLNYAKYFTEGDLATVRLADYSSDAQCALTVDETIELLKTLPEVRTELALRGADVR